MPNPSGKKFFFLGRGEEYGKPVIGIDWKKRGVRNEFMFSSRSGFMI